LDDAAKNPSMRDKPDGLDCFNGCGVDKEGTSDGLLAGVAAGAENARTGVAGR